ncbi:hypothetical protein NIES2135_00280 [Leptolyngbya boryana NIES-2135]|jgi:hypothetical protein|uniref:Uncharacterized protein n=2 Tax=Leptolyngbya boryana TaxID=1184 RepID=A0A1Z4J8Z1_LEPBY|nr:hypothetical protein NIES2135_00280 [Leptolyngbya boryana NIES-2135]
MTDRFYEQQVMQQLVACSPELFRKSRVSLILCRTGNLLLMNREDLVFDPMLCLEFVPIAQLLQKQCGNTRICICTADGVILNLSSEEMIELAETWNIWH